MTATEHKTCRRCQMSKTINKFGYSPERDRYDTLCRPCRLVAMAHGPSDPDLVRAVHTSDMRTHKTCSVCAKRQLLEFFNFNRANRCYSHECKTCESGRHKAYLANPETKQRATARYAEIVEATCKRCGEKKPKEQFAFRASRGGIDTYCQTCRNAMRREIRDKNIKNERLRERRRTCQAAGITVDEFCKILKDQHGRCAICRRHIGDSLHIDHCHKKGTFRGLLCGKCNTGLGQFNDDPVALRAAANYLEMSV